MQAYYADPKDNSNKVGGTRRPSRGERSKREEEVEEKFNQMSNELIDIMSASMEEHDDEIQRSFENTPHAVQIETHVASLRAAGSTLKK